MLVLEVAGRGVGVDVELGEEGQVFVFGFLVLVALDMLERG
jgi:hypothetical protein